MEPVHWSDRLRCQQCRWLHCHWCGVLVETTARGTQNNTPVHVTREHLVPLSHGGSERSDMNLALACRKCNTSRGNQRDWIPLHDEHWRLGPPMPIQQRELVKLQRSRYEYVALNRVGEMVKHAPKR